jgi:hypothetical protein
MSLLSESFTLPSIRWLIELRRRNPKRFAIVAVSVLLAYIGISMAAVQMLNNISEEQRSKNLSFETQLNNLKQAEQSLKGLTAYVEDQQARLKESEDLLSSLRAEKQKLEPLVNADKELIKAVFDAQTQLYGTKQWIGYVASFVLGLLSSIVASIIVNVFRSGKKAKEHAAVA